LFSISEVIDMAVQLERNGERIYRSALDNVRDAGLKHLLAWMADEENRHAKWFSALRSTSVIIEDNDALKAMNQSLVDDFLGDQAFSLKDVDFSVVRNINELLAVFIEFEKDTILFYDILVAFMPDEQARENIRRIIAEEETHVEKLKTFKGGEEK
jgi:rubrerythrin